MPAVKKLTGSEVAEQRTQTDNFAERIKIALSLDAQINKLKAELEVEKKYFIDVIKQIKPSKNTIVTPEGSVKYTETNNYKLEAELIPAIKEFFKSESYEAYVKEKKEYSPTPAYRNLMFDGDYKHNQLLREACKIYQYDSVKFEEVSEVKVSKIKKLHTVK